jgi:hypothetical protein
MVVYLLVSTSTSQTDLKPDKIKHLSCAEVKMHLLGLDKVKELKRFRYESIEAYYRMNCNEWEPQTIIVSPVCDNDPKGIVCDFEGKCDEPYGGPATGKMAVRDGPATGTIGVKDGY